jgi:glucosamine--fructose-6-phosphate aminotransferase (isomerizing)
MLAIEWGFLRRLMFTPQYEELQEQLNSLPFKMNAVLEICRNFASNVAQETIEQSIFTLIASGPNEGVALIGSALLSEGPQRFGLALPLEEFHHSLRQYTLQPGNPVILLATHPTCLQRSLETAIVAHDRGAFLIGILGAQTNEIAKFCRHHITIPEGPESLSPLLTLVPLQELSIQLAERRVIQGYNRPRQ